MNCIWPPDLIKLMRPCGLILIIVNNSYTKVVIGTIRKIHHFYDEI